MSEIPDKWRRFYNGFEKDLKENWINKKEFEKRINSLFPHNKTKDSYTVGYTVALDKVKEMLK